MDRHVRGQIVVESILTFCVGDSIGQLQHSVHFVRCNPFGSVWTKNTAQRSDPFRLRIRFVSVWAHFRLKFVPNLSPKRTQSGPSLCPPSPVVSTTCESWPICHANKRDPLTHPTSLYLLLFSLSPPSHPGIEQSCKRCRGSSSSSWARRCGRGAGRFGVMSLAVHARVDRDPRPAPYSAPPWISS